jgi:hypothetical protein
MNDKLECVKCGHETPMPHHCNRAMHVREIDGKSALVCWMGPECGTAAIPLHCGQLMRPSMPARHQT